MRTLAEKESARAARWHLRHDRRVHAPVTGTAASLRSASRACLRRRLTRRVRCPPQRQRHRRHDISSRATPPPPTAPRPPIPPGEVILFIDEIHSVMGAGEAAGAMDASALLKPQLARGEIAVVGATTLNEYRAIEKDAALARRFQPVMVSEPSPAESLTILRGIKEKYQAHHGVHITDAALVAAVAHARRYMVERRLPDSAIDLLDEVRARPRPLLLVGYHALSPPPATAGGRISASRLFNREERTDRWRRRAGG